MTDTNVITPSNLTDFPQEDTADTNDKADFFVGAIIGATTVVAAIYGAKRVLAARKAKKAAVVETPTTES